MMFTFLIIVFVTVYFLAHLNRRPNGSDLAELSTIINWFLTSFKRPTG